MRLQLIRCAAATVLTNTRKMNQIKLLSNRLTGLQGMEWTPQSCLLGLRPPDPSGHQGQGYRVYPGSEPTLTPTVYRLRRLIYIRAESVLTTAFLQIRSLF